MSLRPWWSMLLVIGSALAFLLVIAVRWTRRRDAEMRRRCAAEVEATIAGQLADETRRRREAEEAARFLEVFVGILGHDLRNPLNSILMAASLLTRQGGDAKIIDRILSSGQRMSKLITQLLDLTRSRLGGGIPVETTDMDLSALVSDVVEELRICNPGRVIQWDPPGEQRARLDPERMGQVVSNLLGNALEHGDPSRTIEVRLATGRGVGGNALALVVHSHGPPIPPELLPVLFDPFRRAAGERGPHSKGLGLGLFITQQIARGHQGTIDVCSTAGEGTTFTVTLPCLAEGSAPIADRAG